MKTMEKLRIRAIEKAQKFFNRNHSTYMDDMIEMIEYMIENFPKEDSYQEVLDEIRELRGQLGCGPIFGTGDGLWGIMKTSDTTLAISAHHTLPKLRDILQEMAVPKPVMKDAFTKAVKRIRHDCCDSAGDEDLDIIEQFARELP